MSALPDRDTLIKERQKNSILWWTIHQLGSLKLAMLLLLTIAIACAVATFAESTFNTKVAHAYIYRAPWFKLWLVVLCVNLFAVTLTRWPWQKKHTGFIVTHYGIIILLIGALIGRIWGFEGNVVLDKDRPLGRIVSNRTILQIDSPRDNATYIADIDIAVKAPTPEKPKLMPIPGSRDKILLTDYTENMQERPVIEEATGNPAAAPGVNLKLQSMMMGGQEIRVPLWLNDQGGLESYNLSGLASIRFMDKLPPATKEQILAPGQGVPFSETQIVFARSPESSVIDNSWGRPAGYMLVFEADESPGAGRLRVTTPAGEESIHTLPRKLPGKFKLADGTDLTVAQSWTDFAIINGRPANDGKDNQNPR
ncbi:cytochrome c biogenesis protein ResB [Oscillatoria laete-virens NRMC-F 0139]|nr:cytochrome c biogenesis protein ResB [Oscillatoria laete-virens]MDL5055545.1 cytochrome c biogenesis protein ResB [Oscillatoria laete-virens NRMC-F 0139]